MNAAEPPEAVRRRAEALGADGRAWLARLPGTVAELERRWSLEVGSPLGGGTHAYVARARTADGTDAVLKIAPPGVGFARQVQTLERAAGRGYARLLGHSPEHDAVLLEHLHPPMDHLGLAPERQLEALSETLLAAWQRPPANATVPPEEEKAGALGRMVSELWHRLDRPCSQEAMALALDYAERRAAAFDLERCVIVHGDPHPANALSQPAASSGFVFIDPDGFVGDPAYDLGVILRDWAPQLLAAEEAAGYGGARGLAERYCGRLAAHSGLDERAIWEWGYVERVSTGLYTMAVGLGHLSPAYLRTAELLL